MGFLPPSKPPPARTATVSCFGYKEPPARQFSQRREVICLPGTPQRAGAPARATALSDWMVCLGLPRPCAGEPAVTNHKSVLQTGTTRSREVSARIGVTSDGADNAPRLRVAIGEDSPESKPPVKRRAKTHTASAHDSSTPVPWRWRSREARIRGLQGTSPQIACPAHRGDLSPGLSSARTRSCQGH